MEGDAEVESGPALRGAPGVVRGVPAAGIDCGPHRLGTSPLGAAGRRGEHSKDAVAKELQNLAVALGDRIADAFEMLIEPAYDVRPRRAVDKGRKVTFRQMRAPGSVRTVIAAGVGELLVAAPRQSRIACRRWTLLPKF
jgi:hypothetical protein